ncbi:hypothetical protein E2F48_04635 [Arthrobacter crusticola]|uniref:DUF4190 domain-containing protein n=1 Tax=Arthrobacter crusticola TaxID=2547960 RepID=A0A4R5TZ16_9MICC|nr:hypothetical protein [Arthrobacter crusticola]TDK26488.1 hypothetical protein E2F48_04635 [Arthrobacter crusticola]
MSQYAHPSRPAYPSEQPFSGGGQFYRGAGTPVDSLAGKKHMQLSLAFGFLSFWLPIVFVPLALIQAGRAERLGEPSTAGKILAWTAVGYWILSAIWAFILYAFIASQLPMLLDSVPPVYSPPV